MTRTLRIAMNGITGRMGYRQHLLRSILPIRDQGGVTLPDGSRVQVEPVLVGLAAGAGALFCIHVTSNTFWLLQSFLGQSVRGALKTVTVGVSVASVIALGMTLILSLFL